MKVIANTGNGYLIEATESEVKEILGAVLGKKPDEIEIGQKIPAIDYASTIRKLKSLPESNEYKSLLVHVDRFNSSIEKLSKVVSKAIEI